MPGDTGKEGEAWAEHRGAACAPHHSTEPPCEEDHPLLGVSPLPTMAQGDERVASTRLVNGGHKGVHL